MCKKIRLQKITAFSVPPLAALILSLILFIPGNAFAKITGQCVNCHTMHNSQGGTEMATYGGETGPNSFLTRGSCVGCHAQGGNKKILTIGDSEIPQVYHTDPDGDLAGGNFAYISGIKGSGASDAKGHNVTDIAGINIDATLSFPPGLANHRPPTVIDITTETLTCSGNNGCHGNRGVHSTGVYAAGSGLPTLKGAHHGNVDGKCDDATTVANSYRFLFSVKGFENTTDRWQNVDENSHNEYYGYTSVNHNMSNCNTCHGTGDAWNLEAPKHTISGFCGTCHPDFHITRVTGVLGHPTDIRIPNEGEYAAYTTYSVEAPVGRSKTYVQPRSPVVTPGGYDVVICLSCHSAHATNYPDLLRWDYDETVSGDGSGGCFICHTEKG